MAFRHFNHLNVPEYWERYFTKYPQGMTILESLFEWVSQVDSMVDNQNKLNDNVQQFRKEIDAFVGRFDERLQAEVTVTLKDWQDTGFLDVVISEAIQWQLDDYISTNEQDKTTINEQMNKRKQVISIRGLGAVGDGIIDDTDIFKQALEIAQNGNIKHIYVENGNYLLSVDENTNSHLLSGILEIPDNTNFEMAMGAKLIVKPNGSTSYNLLTVNGAKNVVIKGGMLQGDTLTHTGTTGEWGYGIALLGAKNVKIENVTIRHMWGDAINLQYAPEHFDCENILIDNVTIAHSRRNGISVESAKNVTIRDSYISDTKGVLPQCGIDVEPWTVDANCENVTIEGCTFERNEANHILLHNNKSGINIIKNNFGDTKEYSVYTLNGITDLIVEGNHFTNSGFWQVPGSGTGNSNKTIITNNLFKRIVRSMNIAKDTLFTSNIVSGDGTKIGLLIPSEENIEITRNVFKNADYGVYVFNKKIDSCNIAGNTFQDVTTCIQIDNTLANRSKNVVISNNVLSGFTLSALNIKGLTGFVIANNIIKSERLTNAAGYYYGILLTGINSKGLITNNHFLANSIGIKLRYGIYSDNPDNPQMRLVGNVLKGGVTTKDGEIFMLANTDVEKFYNVVTE